MQLEYFRMIDKVVALDGAGKTIQCAAQIPLKSPVFEGHFPTHPLMPGVLLIETMAQASGYLLLALNEFSRMAFFIAADRVKLRQFVMPGDELIVDASLQHEGSGFAVTQAKILRAGEKICEAELKFRLMPYPTEDLRTIMRRQAEAVGLTEKV